MLSAMQTYTHLTCLADQCGSSMMIIMVVEHVRVSQEAAMANAG